jgi:enterochelin esterase family protein
VDVAVAGGPRISSDGVVFSIPDPDGTLAAVRLHQEVMRPRAGPEFVRTRDGWQIEVARPNADRMEYKVELVHGDGSSEVVCDPGNPLRALGPFGNKSVIEWPEYRVPGWTRERPSDPGSSFEVGLGSHVLRAELRTILWTAPGASPGDSLPVLVAHDGPEYAEFSELTRALAVAVEAGRLPALHAALLAPVDRDQIYSASAAYSRALAHEILPALTDLAPARGRRMVVGMGASLGALAMLHLHRTNPGSVGGLFLQSGSYFRQRYDRQESGFVRFRRITRFMGRVYADENFPAPVPIVMTCGTAEENLHNNRAAYGALRAQSYDIQLHEHRDAHNWVAWRDTLDPFLIDFLARLWS